MLLLLWRRRGRGRVGIGFDDDDFLVGDDFFGGVEEGEAVGVVDGGGVFVVGEELECFCLESEGEFLEHFGDLRGFAVGDAIHFGHRLFVDLMLLLFVCLEIGDDSDSKEGSGRKGANGVWSEKGE